MKEAEIYYRRSFNLINDLISFYENGYNEADVINYSKQRFAKLDSIMYKENISFIFSSLIALMGINKEKIEETGKNTNYLNYISSLNNSIYDSKISLELKKRRKVETGLDDWLAVGRNFDGTTSNMGYLKKVRNALLHSHFDTSEYNFTKVWNNNKSMFEAYLSNSNFF